MRALQTRLRRLFVGRFSKDELRTLCFDIGVPYENLPENLDGLARELIVYCERHGRLTELVETARELRSDIDWEDLVPAATPGGRRAAGSSARVPHLADAMDAAAIATVATTLLSPYLAQAREDVANETGGAAWEKVRQIHQAIRTRLQEEGDSYPAETLRRFEEQPESRRGAMQSVLQEILDVDPAFARALSVLLQEADRAGAGAVFNVNVFGGTVGEIINIDRLDGGLTIHKRQTSDER